MLKAPARRGNFGFGSKKLEPDQVLEEGWQLYAKPTTLEPVGTVFRIDGDGRRFMVDQLEIKTQQGAEAAARVQQRVQADIGFFARFLGIDSWNAKLGAANAETFEFEIVAPVRQVTFDAAMDQAMEQWLPTLKYRADNRYFVIREARSATAMTYRLTQAQAGEVSGGASLAIALGVGAKVGAGQGGLYEIAQTFPERMRVMFLADEVLPVKAGLAGGAPALGLVKLREPLVWIEEG